MKPQITKANATSVTISVPQPDKSYTVSLKSLYAKRDALNDQIAQAEAQGVVQDAPVDTQPIEVSPAVIDTSISI